MIHNRQPECLKECQRPYGAYDVCALSGRCAREPLPFDRLDENMEEADGPEGT